MKMNNTYQTSDFHLSAVLKSFGFKLIDLKMESGRGLFIFEDRTDRAKIVKDFFSGELVGNIKTFLNALEGLKSLILEMKKEKSHG
jgi:hypothetical protein